MFVPGSLPCATGSKERGCTGVNAAAHLHYLSLIMLRHPSGVALGVHEGNKAVLWQQLPSAWRDFPARGAPLPKDAAVSTLGWVPRTGAH